MNFPSLPPSFLLNAYQRHLEKLETAGYTFTDTEGTSLTVEEAADLKINEEQVVIFIAP